MSTVKHPILRFSIALFIFMAAPSAGLLHAQAKVYELQTERSIQLNLNAYAQAGQVKGTQVSAVAKRLDRMGAEEAKLVLEPLEWRDLRDLRTDGEAMLLLRFVLSNSGQTPYGGTIFLPELWYGSAGVYRVSESGFVPLGLENRRYSFYVPPGSKLEIRVITSLPGLVPQVWIDPERSGLYSRETETWVQAALVVGAFILAFLLCGIGISAGFPAWIFLSAGLAWSGFWVWLEYWGGVDILGSILPGWVGSSRVILGIGPVAAAYSAALAALVRSNRQQFRYWAGFSVGSLLVVVITVLVMKENARSLMQPVCLGLMTIQVLGCLFFRSPGDHDGPPRFAGLDHLVRMEGLLLGACLLLFLLVPETAWRLPLPGTYGGAVLWLLVQLVPALLIFGAEIIRIRRREKRSLELERQVIGLEGVIKTSLKTIEIQKDEIKRLGETEESGLLKREPFFQALEKEFIRFMRYNHGFSLMLVDLDKARRFQTDIPESVVNWVRDWFPRSIRSQIRASDVCGRFGEWTVAVLLPETPPLQAMLAAEKIRAMVQDRSRLEPVFPTELKGTLTVSLGIASPRKDGQDIHRLIQETEDALNRARSAGGNRAALSVHALKDTEPVSPQIRPSQEPSE